MKKYSIITLIMGIIVSLFVLLTRLLGFGWVLLIALIPVSNFALFIASHKINGISKKLVLVLLFIVSITINISFLLATTLVIANLPPEKPFDPGIKIDSPDPNAEKAYLDLQPMFEKLNEKGLYTNQTFVDYIKKDMAFDEKLIKIINNSKDDRLNIISIISAKPFYISDTDYPLDLSKINPSSKGMQSFFTIELVETKQLFINGENDKALKKYELLWKSSINFIKSKGIHLSDAFHAKATVSKLIGFYLYNKEFFKKDDIKNLNLNFEELSKDIENCMQKGYMREYLQTVNYMKDFKYNWPLLDHNKTSKKLYDNFLKITHETELSAPNEQDDNYTDEFESYYNNSFISNLKYYIKNPIGNYLYFRTRRDYDGINKTLYSLKDNIKKMSLEAY